MTYAESGGYRLYYETFGSPENPTLLLVMGLGAQCIVWDTDFCNLIVAEGYQVVRFDNRDVGLSSRTQAPLPVFTAPTAGSPLVGLAGEPVYTLTDMANDACAVLNAIGVDKAHIVGASLGGMIAQHIAFEHPDRALSLVSIMSTTGAPGVGGPTEEAALALLTPSPVDREGAIEHGVKATRIISGPLFDEARAREFCAVRYDRAFNPSGPTYQLAAAIADGDRTDRLASVTCPTLVVHGLVDPLIQVSGGHATTAAIPDARELVLDEMGHDLPPVLWSVVVEAIDKNARRATVA